MIEAIIRKFAGAPFTLSKLNAAAVDSLSGAELRAALPDMLRKGRVAAVKKSWGDRLYYIPGDVLINYWSHWDNLDSARVIPGNITLLQAAKRGLVADLFRSLTWIAHHGLPLTAKGTIHQKSLNKWLEQIELAEKDLVGLDLHYPHQEAYPAHAAVLLDMLLALGLIRKERGAWSLNAHELSVWLGRSAQQMNDKLLREVLLRYVPDDVTLSHFAFRLIAADLAERQWYSIREVCASLTEQRMLPGELPEDKQLWMRSWLEALSGMGWMDLGESHDGELVFRWSVKPVFVQQNSEVSESQLAAEALFYIQPDFEIIVPPEVSFRVRWELELYCESVTMDVMSIYRLSRTSIAAATQQGRTVEEAIDFLHNGSAGIPDNVLLSLKQWAKEMGRTSLAEVQLLRCKDEEAAGRITAHPELMEMLEPIGPLAFIVDPIQLNKVEKALEELGLAPPRPGLGQASQPQYIRLEAAAEIAEQEAAPNRDFADLPAWIYNGRDYQFYERDISIPKRDQLFPGMQDIPAVWLKELRKYHPSTARKIAQQALEWDTKIILRMDEQLVELIPERLEGDENWRIHGLLMPPDRKDSDKAQRQVSLGPEQWEEMRILLPEI
ncbi:helicase-associated domain-containing protein [Paenibacillus sp. GM2]|uniref:helicase-associated domain-containing protein n=1 Tax=Paenibacillus sp. GM2 TaxID=1622070 RepID=UPI000839C106|nr:helicase-associated domain-containing protein [Paenibacillus sp. GM2]